MQQVLIEDRWREAASSGSFQADDPKARQAISEQYPVSTWEDCDAALDAAVAAADVLRQLPSDRIAAFLDRYAERIEARSQEICEWANQETALPVSPRLAAVELPRTTSQLRQAATAAREGTWREATLDTAAGIRSYYAALGPVCIFGPNNFPLAFNSISGGDFAAAIAAGNPVIAKANSSHPGTTRVLAEEALGAQQDAELPTGTVQLLYRTSHPDGERLVADPRLGATGYTGSRSAGLKLKAAADRAGKPIYLELSSINPVVILPEALKQRSDEIAQEFTGSCLMGTGQFCTNPGLVVLLKGPATDAFIQSLTEQFQQAPVGTLLSKGVAENLSSSIQHLTAAGAEVLVGNEPGGGEGYSFANTLLKTDAQTFVGNPAGLQEEAFGNASLLIVADDVEAARQVLEHIEGNLTGCIYSDTQGADDASYDQLAPRLRQRVGRLLNDKMPTGVAVSPAMNHGGPFPATGHPGFTAVGIPAALKRFSMLQCFDNVRPHRLPVELQDKNPNGSMWRYIDGAWTTGDVS